MIHKNEAQPPRPGTASQGDSNVSGTTRRHGIKRMSGLRFAAAARAPPRCVRVPPPQVSLPTKPRTWKNKMVRTAESSSRACSDRALRTQWMTNHALRTRHEPCPPQCRDGTVSQGQTFHGAIARCSSSACNRQTFGPRRRLESHHTPRRWQKARPSGWQKWKGCGAKLNQGGCAKPGPTDKFQSDGLRAKKPEHADGHGRRLSRQRARCPDFSQPL
jgi:hypothetical protein